MRSHTTRMSRELHSGAGKRTFCSCLGSGHKKIWLSLRPFLLWTTHPSLPRLTKHFGTSLLRVGFSQVALKIRFFYLFGFVSTKIQLLRSFPGDWIYASTVKIVWTVQTRLKSLLFYIKCLISFLPGHYLIGRPLVLDGGLARCVIHNRGRSKCQKLINYLVNSNLWARTLRTPSGPLRSCSITQGIVWTLLLCVIARF